VFSLNVPNVLTLLRIMLVPVLVVALLDKTPDGDALAAGVFAVASLTDFIDGYLARARDSITTFGKLMDPIADKLLVIGAVITLVSLHRVAAWVAMVIIAREFAVTATRMAATQAGVIIAANRWGKAKTAVQVLTILVLISVDGRPLWLTLLVDGMVAVTLLSGVDYFFGLRRQLSLAQARRSESTQRASGTGESLI